VEYCCREFETRTRSFSRLFKEPLSWRGKWRMVIPQVIGGMPDDIEIDYCPFCGKEIPINAKKSD